jgi:hypothetical protein
MIVLARESITCQACFSSDRLVRAGIDLPQPFSVGDKYREGGTIVISINPGASSDGGYKEARAKALQRFSAGDEGSLVDYWNSLAEDASEFWNPNYLARINKLGLELHNVAVGNIALCATRGNKYPNWMLRKCWSTHSAGMLRSLRPGVVILMAGEGVMSPFERSITEEHPGCKVFRMAHFAHREGNDYEANECARVREHLRG